MRWRSGWAIMAVGVAVSMLTGVTSASASSDVVASEPSASQVVVLRNVTGDEVDATAAALTGSFGGSVTITYSSAFVGFAAEMTAAQAAAMTADPRVASIEPDVTMWAGGTVGLGATNAKQPTPTKRWATDSWALDRLDDRNPKLDGTFHNGDDPGAGVTAYVLDTGIYADHPDFEGRASTGVDFVPFEPPVDLNGHGTHVAGLIGGAAHGVAPDATIVAIKVLNATGGGPLSNILAGLDWVAKNHVSPAVVNMSLSGPPSDILDTAVANVIASGVSVVAAAGNAAADACNGSPGDVAAAIIVGASDSNDAVPAWSDQGPCVDLFAPGDAVVSDWIPVFPGGGTPPPGWIENPTVTLSGTSMAAPLVSGAVALYLSNHPNADPEHVAKNIVGDATKKRLSNVTPTTANLLLFVNA